MNFDDIFSTSDQFGLFFKESIKRKLKESLDDTDKDTAIALLKLEKEIIEELIKEIDE
jgi:hypothetical protein